jgi:hypothetical protein
MFSDTTWGTTVTLVCIDVGTGLLSGVVMVVEPCWLVLLVASLVGMVVVFAVSVLVVVED